MRGNKVSPAFPRPRSPGAVQPREGALGPGRTMDFWGGGREGEREGRTKPATSVSYPAHGSRSGPCKPPHKGSFQDPAHRLRGRLRDPPHRSGGDPSRGQACATLAPANGHRARLRSCVAPESCPGRAAPSGQRRGGGSLSPGTGEPPALPGCPRLPLAPPFPLPPGVICIPPAQLGFHWRRLSPPPSPIGASPRRAFACGGAGSPADPRRRSWVGAAAKCPAERLARRARLSRLSPPGAPRPARALGGSVRFGPVLPGGTRLSSAGCLHNRPSPGRRWLRAASLRDGGSWPSAEPACGSSPLCCKSSLAAGGAGGSGSVGAGGISPPRQPHLSWSLRLA